MLELLKALDTQISLTKRLAALGVDFGELVNSLQEESIQMICTTIVGERIERGLHGKEHPRYGVYMDLVLEIDDWLGRRRDNDYVMVNFDGSLTVQIKTAKEFLAALLQLHNDMVTGLDNGK